MATIEAGFEHVAPRLLLFAFYDCQIVTTSHWTHVVPQSIKFGKRISLGDLVHLVWSRNNKHWMAKWPRVDIEEWTEIRQFELYLMRENMAVDIF